MLCSAASAQVAGQANLGGIADIGECGIVASLAAAPLGRPVRTG
jgi:hypothetical protein